MVVFYILNSIWPQITCLLTIHVYRVEGDATHVHKSKHCFYRIYLPDNTSSWLIGSQESSFLGVFQQFQAFPFPKKSSGYSKCFALKDTPMRTSSVQVIYTEPKRIEQLWITVRDLHVSLILRGSRAQTEGHNKFNFHFRTLISYTLVCLLNVLRVRNHAPSNPPQLLLQQQIIPTKPTMVGRFPLIGIVNQLFPYGWT